MMYMGNAVCFLGASITVPDDSLPPVRFTVCPLPCDGVTGMDQQQESDK